MTVRPRYAASTGLHRKPAHLPMQKREKISPSRSSALNSPVISPSAFCASRSSSASRSSAAPRRDRQRHAPRPGVRARRAAPAHGARAAMNTPSLRRPRLPAGKLEQAAAQGRRPAPLRAHKAGGRRRRRRQVGLVADVQHRSSAATGAGARSISASPASSAGLAEARQVVQEQHRVGALDLAPGCARCRCARPRRAPLAHAGGVDHVQRHAFDLDRLGSPCRAWCRRSA